MPRELRPRPHIIAKYIFKKLRSKATALKLTKLLGVEITNFESQMNFTYLITRADSRNQYLKCCLCQACQRKIASSGLSAWTTPVNWLQKVVTFLNSNPVCAMSLLC